MVITRGENKGKLRVKNILSSGNGAIMEAKRELERDGYGFLFDCSNVFRDKNDEPVVTFSPYGLEIMGPKEEIALLGYDVDISDYSIYGYGTQTVVIRKKMW